MKLRKALETCINLIEEDLQRYVRVQCDDPRAFGGSEARALKDYLAVLSTAYKTVGETPPDPELAELDTDEIIEELKRLEQGEN